MANRLMTSFAEPFKLFPMLVTSIVADLGITGARVMSDRSQATLERPRHSRIGWRARGNHRHNYPIRIAGGLTSSWTSAFRFANGSMTYRSMRGTYVPWHATGATPLSRATAVAAPTTSNCSPSSAIEQLLVDAVLVMTTFGTKRASAQCHC